MAGIPYQLENLATVIAIPTPTAEGEPETSISHSPASTAMVESTNGDHKSQKHRESDTSAQSLPPPTLPHAQQRPPLDRGQSQIQMALNESANFIGWNDTEGDVYRNWGSKRLRFLAKKYNLDPIRVLTEARSIDAGHHDVMDQPGPSSGEPSFSHAHSAEINFPFLLHTAFGFDGGTPGSTGRGRSFSQGGNDLCVRVRAERRESMARLAVNVCKRGLSSTPRNHRVRLSSRQSFDLDVAESERGGSPPAGLYGLSPQPQLEDNPLEEALIQSRKMQRPGLRRLQSDEPQMKMSGPTLRRLQQRDEPPIPEESSSELSSLDKESANAARQQSEPMPPLASLEEIEMGEVPSIYETPSEEPSPLPSEQQYSTPSDKTASTDTIPKPKLSSQEHVDADDLFFAFSCASEIEPTARLKAGKDRPMTTLMELPKLPVAEESRIALGGISRLDIGDGRIHIPVGKVALGPVSEEDRVGITQPDRPLLDAVKSRTRSLPRYPLLKQTSVVETHKRGLVEDVLANLGRQSSNLFIPRYRRYRGIGALSSFYEGSLHREKIDALDPKVRDIIERGSDERPLFTWWVTSVQVLVCIVSLLIYGLGPFGWERVEMNDEVIDVSLAMRQVSYYEPVNLWIGPRFADLIRLGAKYSPCMRREPGLWRLINEERAKENGTGCCVFNDGTGCYQTGQSSCPRTLATWHKWALPKPPLKKSKSETQLIDLDKNSVGVTVSRRRGSLTSAISHHSWRTAGAVCGQDPDFCVRPSSVRPYEWPDDLTRWPICLEHREGGFLPPHMTCQITGRPCCIQMQGQCRIATREYCAFVKGHFHENATLCSQVNCFSDFCGMLPFLWHDWPDQFYRMFFSLFLHAGVIHLAITIWVQLWLMLDLEMLIGWHRMAILYFGSGIGGNFASAIFVPYNPEVGPAGSHLGIMAALVIDLYHHRSIIVRPQRELGKHMCTVLVLFLTGLLPWVDNWAHLFGFIFGLLITIVSFGFFIPGCAKLSFLNVFFAVTFPYLDFESHEKPRQGCRSSLSRRNIAIVMSLITSVLLYILLGYIYFNRIELDCPWCEYFNCINIRFITGSNHFCDNRGQKLSQWLPI